jgi:trehalose 6-phosphate synthase
VLKGAVSVNPFDTEGVARALKDALELPKTERAERAAQLRARVGDLDVHLWAKRFLNSLERA